MMMMTIFGRCNAFSKADYAFCCGHQHFRPQMHWHRVSWIIQIKLHGEKLRHCYHHNRNMIHSSFFAISLTSNLFLYLPLFVIRWCLFIKSDTQRNTNSSILYIRTQKLNTAEAHSLYVKRIALQFN